MSFSARLRRLLEIFSLLRDKLFRGRPHVLHDVVFFVLMAIASCVCVWPWLSLSVIPTQDSPAHLALVSAMRHLGEEGHVLNEAFTWGQFPAPNSLYYLLGLALAPLTGLCYYPEERKTGFASLTWRHLGQYHTVVNEGLTSYTFANHPGRMIVQKEPGYDFEYIKSDTLKDKRRIKPYDLLLQVGTTRLEEKKYKKSFALIARKNLWSLYQVAIE